MKPTYTIDQNHVKLGIHSPVYWGRHRLQGNVPPHDHDFTEVGIVTEGTAKHATERGSQVLKRGDVFVIPKGVTHAFLNPKDCSVVNIYYLADWFIKDFHFESEHASVFMLFFSESQNNARQVPVETLFSLEAVDSIPLIIAELEAITKTFGAVSLSWKSCCFKKVLLLLADAFLKENKLAVQKLPQLVWNYYREVDRTLHAREPLDLLKVSKKLAVTRDYLGATFRKHLGSTPHQFFQRRRIQFVCQELLKSGGSISPIAYEYGFTDEAHLCHQFKKVMEMTPVEYRKKYQG